MTVELSAEDLAYVEDLVKAGRFSSAEEVIHAAMSLLAGDSSEPTWNAGMQSAIDEGVAAQQQHDFATDSDMDLLFEKFQQKTA